MTDMDDLLLEVNVLPHQSDDLTAAHPRVKGNQQESPGPDITSAHKDRKVSGGRKSWTRETDDAVISA